MKEYWVNVYSKHSAPLHRFTENKTQFEAIVRGAEMEDLELEDAGYIGVVLYRIHVKIKEPAKPKYEPEHIGFT